jgi:hypothetical protein
MASDTESTETVSDARRGVLVRVADPGVASVLRLLNTFGGGGLAAGALVVWTQWVSPYLTETRELLHKGLERQEVLARHVADVERRLGIATPVTSDPAWLMLRQEPRAGGLIPIAAAEPGGAAPGGAAPGGAAPVLEGSATVADTDTGVDVAPQVPAGGPSALPFAGR